MTSRYSWTARALTVGLAFLAPAAVSAPTRAQMVVVSGAGPHVFTLTTFASGFPNAGGSGPGGIAYDAMGRVLVTCQGRIYLMPSHTDGQAFVASWLTADYGPAGVGALAQIQVGGQWKYYLGRYAANKVVEIDGNGSVIQDIANMTTPLGIAPYPPGAAVGSLTGHLFVVDGAGNIWDVDPQAQQANCGVPLPCSTTLFTASIGGVPDGLSFSQDGFTVYVAYVGDNVIRAYDTSTAALTWTSPPVPVGPDGIAIGIGSLTGYIYVNCNSGDVWELGVPPNHTGEVYRIATGGSRGDFIAVDPNVWSGGAFPSLLLTQTDRILRLDPPGGGWFGPPTSSTIPVGIEVGTPFCFGDGTGTACPCANNGDSGRGCANIAFASGALLFAAGQSSVSADSVVLTSTSMSGNSSLHFQATGQAAVPFGYGINCLSDSLLRIGLKSVVNGSSTNPSGVDLPISVKGGVPPVGGTRHYQTVYRQVNPPCAPVPSTLTNRTNGLTIAWTP